MRIAINNRQALVTEGISLELSFENRRFTGADTYSLSITFPLKDCADNIAIFGHINRKDVAAGLVLLDCTIESLPYMIIEGALAVIEISDTEVKGQFLAGRSATNYFNTWDDVLINELKLGTCVVPNTQAPEEFLKPYDTNRYGLALTWTNTESGVTHNRMSADLKEWSKYNQTLSTQVYLLTLLKNIFDAVGYVSDLSAIEATDLRHLVVCNALPRGWDLDERARTLPAWSLSELIEQLGLFLRGEFDVDHKMRTVSFKFYSDIDSNRECVRIDRVLREFSSEISTEELAECDYIDAKNIAYADAGHEMWKYWSCPWFVKAWADKLMKFPTATAMRRVLDSQLTTTDHARGPEMALIHVAENDSYYILRTVESEYANGQYKYHNTLQRINEFGPRTVIDDEDADVEELNIVPVCIDAFGEMFLSPGTYSEPEVITGDPAPDETAEEKAERLAQTVAARILAAGENSKKAEYYDKLYIGYWAGARYGDENYLKTPPHAYVSDSFNLYNTATGSTIIETPFTLSLNKKGGRFTPIHNINRRQKFKFSFIYNGVPDVGAVFLINGRRFLAEKITATLSDRGLSQLLKGEFYMIDE